MIALADRLDHFAGQLRRGVEWAGDVVVLAGQTLSAVLRGGLPWRDTIGQVQTIGVHSLSVVVLTAIFSSMVMTVQFAVQMGRFGAKEYVGNVVSISLARELGPVLTALMVGGRVGAGITAELGSMNVTEQIDAMRSMGANPVRVLVVPRVIAAALSLPLLTVLAVALGIAAAIGIAVVDTNVSAIYFYNSIIRAVQMEDLLGGLVKTVFFGLAIALIACQRGLATRGGTEGVGQATTQTVVITSLVTLISDFILTKFLLAFGM